MTFKCHSSALFRGALRNPPHTHLLLPLDVFPGFQPGSPHRWFLKLVQGSSRCPSPRRASNHSSRSRTSCSSSRTSFSSFSKKTCKFSFSQVLMTFIGSSVDSLVWYSSPWKADSKVASWAFSLRTPPCHWFQKVFWAFASAIPSLWSAPPHLLRLANSYTSFKIQLAHDTSRKPSQISSAKLDIPSAPFLNMLPGKPQDSGDSYILWSFLISPNFFLKQA